MPDWIRLAGDELLRRISHLLTPGNGEDEKVRFWTKQGIEVLTSLVLVIGLALIWFDGHWNCVGDVPTGGYASTQDHEGLR